jgi:hypothetical protein
MKAGGRGGHFKPIRRCQRQLAAATWMQLSVSNTVEWVSLDERIGLLLIFQVVVL